jgi:hypothetical protein
VFCVPQRSSPVLSQTPTCAIFRFRFDFNSISISFRLKLIGLYRKHMGLDAIFIWDACDAAGSKIGAADV